MHNDSRSSAGSDKHIISLNYIPAVSSNLSNTWGLVHNPWRAPLKQIYGSVHAKKVYVYFYKILFHMKIECLGFWFLVCTI